jgi:hypothetical protein
MSLSYRELQKILRKYREKGLTTIKLNIKKVLLIAEYERITGNKQDEETKTSFTTFQGYYDYTNILLPQEEFLLKSLYEYQYQGYIYFNFLNANYSELLEEYNRIKEIERRGELVQVEKKIKFVEPKEIDYNLLRRNFPLGHSIDILLGLRAVERDTDLAWIIEEAEAWLKGLLKEIEKVKITGDYRFCHKEPEMKLYLIKKALHPDNIKLREEQKSQLKSQNLSWKEIAKKKRTRPSFYQK